MDLQFHCPRCNTFVSADSDLGGDMAQCPECDAQIMVPMDAIGTGMVVGNYKILKKLGTGGMGDVYMAEQNSLNRRVALKVLPPAMTRDPKMAERFLQEMRNQAALNHPNIATAYDAGKDRDIYYLAMEYVEGVDLQRILNKREKLPEREALRIGLEIARGLDYAWYKKKIIHRDIKPGNVIISKDAEVRILDMGLSRSMTEVVDLSKTNYLVGTPLYMSPEQLDSDVKLDFRTDMYSLGSTLYHMLTGETPYKGKTVTQILAQRATKDPLPIRELNPDISEGCAAVVHAMMARNRNDRFADWPATIASINQALAGDVPLTPVGIAAAQKAQEDSNLIEVAGDSVPVSTPGRVPAKNPMIPVYLAGLGVLALALVATIIGFVKMKPRIVTVEVPVPMEVAAATLGPEKPAGLSERLDAARVEQPTLPALATNLVAAKSALSEEAEARLRKEREDEGARDEAQAMYDYSVENLLKSPEDFDPHVERFTQVMKEAERLEMFTLKEVAEQEIDRLKKLKRDRIADLLDRLQEQATVAIDAGDYDQAAKLVMEYDGPMMGETLHVRKSLATSVRKKANSVQKTRELEGKQAVVAYRKLVEQLSDSIVTNRNAAALVLIMNPAKTDPVLEPVREKVYELDGLVNLLADIEKNILFTFRTEIGKTLEVEFLNEVKNLVIKSVEENKVMASQLVEGEAVGGTFGFSFGLEELAMPERLTRIERANGERSPFVLGFMALHADKETVALEYFKKSMNDLSASVIEHVEEIAQQRAEERSAQAHAALEREAKWAFANVLHSARLPTASGDEEVLLAAHAQNLYDEDRQRVVTLMASSFREKYGSTEFARRYALLLRQLGGQAYRKLTVDELKRELGTHNPEYNGGGVFETNLFSVITINFDGTENVSDLSPLKNLPVQALRLTGPHVNNVQALEGMPLRSLVLQGTSVKDLAPIKEAPLERLSLEDSQGIRDIKVLRSGGRLKVLNLLGTPVSDLKPLRGHPLEQLLVGFNTREINALTELPLKKLSLAGSKVKNLTALSGKKLEILDLLDTSVTDVTVLKDLPLKLLKLQPGKIIKGLEALRESESLVQFQIAVDTDPISKDEFWKLVDDGAFESKVAPEPGTVRK